MIVGFLFPGQGSQKVGMGRDLYGAYPLVQEVFHQAEAISGLPLRDLCFKGNNARLTATEHAQPALFTLSYALLEVLRAEGIQPAVTAGHSLGEYTALTCAGALSFEDGLGLVTRRGALMAEGGRRDPGAMATVSRLPVGRISEVLAEEALDVWLANFNHGDQIIVSGRRDHIHRAIASLEKAGGRALPLNVSGAFHSPLLDREAELFREAVASVEIRAPHIPVLSNVTAEPLETTEAVRRELEVQMTAPVCWIDIMDRLREMNPSLLLEVGPEKVMKGLMMRHAPRVRVFTTETVPRLRSTITVCRAVIISATAEGKAQLIGREPYDPQPEW